MGDRGNIVIRHGETSIDDVWFYTHWYGSEMPAVVQRALNRKARWTDPYLARIVFSELLKAGGEHDDSELGFSITTSMQDNEHDIVVVDIPKQLVWIIEEKALVDFRLPALQTSTAWPFKDYIELNDGMHKLPTV